MKEITKYQASDGKCFDTKQEATYHEELLKIADWYESHKLMGKYEGSIIEWEDFLEWVQENRSVIQKLTFTI